MISLYLKGKMAHNMISVSKLMLEIGHRLEAAGIKREQYEIETGPYHTIEVSFVDENYALLFKIAFADHLTTLEEEAEEERERMEAMYALFHSKQAIAQQAYSYSAQQLNGSHTHTISGLGAWVNGLNTNTVKTGKIGSNKPRKPRI